MPRRKNNPVQEWPDSWFYIALALLAFALYANSLGNGFVSDDRYQILQNSAVTDSHRIADIFKHDVWAFAGHETTNYYRPLPILVYMLLYLGVGPEPLAFHLVMVLLNALNTVLVFALGRRWLGSRRAAAIAGVLFAVHPIHTEAVDWIACLPDQMLCAVTLWMLLRFTREDAAPRGARPIAIHAALFLAALLIKEPGVMIALLYFGYEWLFLGRSLRDIWKHRALYLAFAGAFAVYLAMRIGALGAFAPGQGLHVKLQASELSLSIVILLGRYLQKLVLPIPLSWYYEFEPTRSISAMVIFSLLAILITTASILWFRKRAPLISYGLFFILVPLAPVLNLNGVGPNPFPERYLFIASVGFVMIAALGVESLIERQPQAAWIAMALVTAGSAYVVVARNADWRDDVRLLNVSLAQYPRSAAMWSDLGSVYFEQHALEKAEDSFRRASSLQPGVALYSRNLGAALLLQGRAQEALSALEQAHSLAPGDAETNNEWGAALQATGQDQRAVEAYQAALLEKPNLAGALEHLGQLRIKERDYSAAVDLFTRAIAARPDFTDAYVNMGLAYNGLKRPQDAVRALLQALRIDPNLYVAHYNLGISYFRLNQIDDATREFQSALQVKPDYAPARAALEQIAAAPRSTPQ